MFKVEFCREQDQSAILSSFPIQQLLSPDPLLPAKNEFMPHLDMLKTVAVVGDDFLPEH